MAGLDQKLKDLIEPELDALGYELIRVRISGGTNINVQIMAEKPDRTMDVEDCAKVSRVVSELFDEKDPITENYTLEVSSPGIARPLVRQKDFEEFAGMVVKIELKDAMDGRKRFRGVLDGMEDGHVMVAVEGDKNDDGDDMVWGLPFEEIAEARLVMTDELIAAQTQAAAEQSEQDEN